VLPSVLASDPWVPARKRAALSLVPIERAIIAWAPNEKQTAAAPHVYALGEFERELKRAEERDAFLRGGIIPISVGRFLELEDLPLLARGHVSGRFVSHHDLLRPALARRGEAAIPTLLSLMAAWPHEITDVLHRVDATSVARFFFDARTTMKSAYERWSRAHAETTALALLPAALGPDGDARKDALAALRALRKAGCEGGIRSAAALYGDGAREEIDALFAPPRLPAKPPKLPAFVDADTLSPIALVRDAHAANGDATTLPRDAMMRLLQLATLLPQECARAALDSALPALDRAGLADLADALLARWLAVEAPPKEKWIIFAAALFGDDRAVRALVGRAVEWSEAKLSARAKLAIEAIVAIGSDVALMHVSFLARKKGGPRAAANAALEKFREDEDLSEDELADRTVPALGLDTRGTMLFDYGARSFRAGFDEELRPFVVDANGVRTASLPRASKADDEAKVASAQALWQSLKDETKALSAEQIRRLERAMITRRAWDRAAFERYFIAHPLMQHLAQRLVWRVFDAIGSFDSPRAPALTFRIAEDRTFSNDEDAPCVLAEDARIGVVHPLELTEVQRARWSTILSDYQIIQPFAQIGRELFAPTEEEATGSKTARFVGKRALGARFFSLKHRGWRFLDYDMSKSVGEEAGQVEAMLHTEPGLFFLASKPEDQTLGELTLRGRGTNASAPTFGSLSAIAASELFRDVDALLR
jgi:hypothetical protein